MNVGEYPINTRPILNQLMMKQAVVTDAETRKKFSEIN